MIQKKCSVCGIQFPQAEMYKIREELMCVSCSNDFIKKTQDIRDQDVEKCIDNTICFNCGMDNGTTPHNLIANLPYCPKCTSFLRNRPFPQWIKMAALAIVLILIASLAWNYRFYVGFKNFYKGKKANVNGNIVEASLYFDAASKAVPEDVGLKNLSTYFKGLKFLSEDSCAAALECFESVKGLIAEEDLQYFKQTAKIGIAFDSKNYDDFLSLSLEMLEKNPDNPIAIAQVSSAYACKYATTGQHDYYEKSIQYLNSARAIADTLTDFKEYEDRIFYRLETKIIISRDEFRKLFPNGWKQNRED